MQSIGINETLIKSLVEERSLTSSRLYRIDIHGEHQDLLIDLYFHFHRLQNPLKLTFSGIKQYSFYHDSNYIFYNVEIAKFFIGEEGVYLSLDPIDEVETISIDDQDFVLSDKVEGFMVV